jgi:hypothetical protein
VRIYRKTFVLFLLVSFLVIVTYRNLHMCSGRDLRDLNLDCVPQDQKAALLLFVSKKEADAREGRLFRALMRTIGRLENDYELRCFPDGSYAFIVLHGNPFKGEVYQIVYRFSIRDDRVILQSSVIVKG